MRIVTLIFFALLPFLATSQRPVGRASHSGHVVSPEPLRQLLPVSLTCPSQSLTCSRNQVCCPNLCCPRRLPFCITPFTGPSVCGTADAKVECEVPSGEKLLGTLCSSLPSVCCPFRGFQRCTPFGPLNCVNERGFIRCVVDGRSRPGVLCSGQGDVCCQNPGRCCKDGSGCCATGNGGPLPLDPFPKVVLGLLPMKVNTTENSKEKGEGERKRCGDFETRIERRRCVRLRRRQRRLCRICRRRREKGCDQICKRKVV